MLKAYEVAKEANKAARSFIRAGVTGDEVFEVIREVAESYDKVKEPDQRAGYSMGLSFPRDWGEGQIISIKKGEDRPLEAGMTFHLTGTHASRWPSSTNHGMVRCSDTILVTEIGCDTLTNGIERKLFVK